jgi:hypothetical protein
MLHLGRVEALCQALPARGRVGNLGEQASGDDRRARTTDPGGRDPRSRLPGSDFASRNRRSVAGWPAASEIATR